MKHNDYVRILTDRLSAALVTELGYGRYAVYTGQVIAVKGKRVQVMLHEPRRAMWFDAAVLTTNLTLPMEVTP